MLIVRFVFAILHIPFDSESNFDNAFLEFTKSFRATQHFHSIAKWGEQFAELGAEVAVLISLIYFYADAKSGKDHVR